MSNITDTSKRANANMHMQYRDVAALSFVFLIAAASGITSDAFCTNFTIIPQLYCTEHNQCFEMNVLGAIPFASFRVSPIHTCTTDSQYYYSDCDGCLLEPENGLVISQPSMVNLTHTISVGDKVELFSLISATTGINFPLSVNITMGMMMMENHDCTNVGQSSFLDFEPSLQCVDGVLLGCSSSDSNNVPDGTIIRACSGTIYQGQLGGAVAVVDTSNDTASVVGSAPVSAPVPPISLGGGPLTYTPLTVASSFITKVPPYSSPTPVPTD